MELILNPSSRTPSLCHYDAVDDPVVSRFKWYLCQPGSGQKSYAATWLNGRSFFMHRLILANACNGLEVDHINGNGLDNRRENLRVCTQAQNRQNSPGWIKRKSQYKGVSPISRWRTCKTGKIWEARICYGRKQRVIGAYVTEAEAARAYDLQARIHHGKFARLNFPEPGEMGVR